METILTPDQLIEELGGCGRFQIRLSVLVHIMKTAACWGYVMMAIIGKTPVWWCVDDVINSNMTPQQETTANNTVMMKSCINRNGTPCRRFEFDGNLKTFVSEFGLVCDKAFIPATIMSIQIIGTFICNPLAGQIADLIGRKKPIFVGMFLIATSNLLGYFSTSWIMLAICRLFAGMGDAFFLTVTDSLMSEFSLASWRPWITGFPSWPIEACILVFIAWLLQDWRYMQLTCSLTAAFFLFCWIFIPESFRWYLSHDRHTEAKMVIKKVANVNKHQMPDLQTLSLTDDKKDNDHKKYTFLHLFKSRYLVKVTLLCSTNWFALGFVAYGLNFGIQALSGNVFLNFFLFQVVVIPAKLLASYLLNRIGRRKTSLLCFIVTGIGGFVVGVVQQIDTEYRDELTNGFAMLANMGIAGAWGTVQTMTIELYPTVIRNIGYGSLSTLARLGAIIGPQVVFLDTFIPGVLYFVCGGVSVVSIIALMFLPETMGGHLQDKLEETETVVDILV